MSDSAESRESSSSSSSSSDSESSDEEVNYKRSVKSSVAVKRKSVSERSPRNAKEDGALTSEESPDRKRKSTDNGARGAAGSPEDHSRRRSDKGDELAERRRQREERHRRERRPDDHQRDRRRDNGQDERRQYDRRDRERPGRDGDRRERRDNDQKDHDAGGERFERKRKRDGEEPAGNEEEKKAPAGEKGNDMENFLAAKRARNKDDTLMTKTGGAYIPPARLRMMQQQITDKASMEFQRIAWEALKKSINGLVNKVNVSNIILIVREVFQENIVRGRGVMSRSIIQAQSASPTFTHVYAALVAIVNTKFPQNGELILKRLILNFKKGFRRNDKTMCMSSVKFIAHLVNQQVAHEILALEILTLLLENPTDDSVEVAIAFLKESGQKLTEVSPRGMHAIFERLRTILHEAQVDKRVQYMCEVMFATRKDGFKEHPAVIEELDLVEEEDQFTHMLTLDDAVNSEDMLNVFKFDSEYEANEERYKALKKEILDEGSSDEGGSASGSDSGSGSDSDSDEEGGGPEEEEGEKTTIIDETETNLVALRRTIYLTIQSSLDFEECAHKLLKMEFKPGQESELCAMILDCCAQQRTYEKFYGLLAQRFCMIDKKYLGPFQSLFGEQYVLCHRLETNKLRNVAKFFAHLLYSDAMSWEVLQIIKLNEDDTTSSSRIFIKVLFQELCEYMGLAKLNTRLKDETLHLYFEGLFPRDNPRNTRFAINFFTSIGLGGLTDELRAHLKNKDSSDSSSSSSDSSSSDSDSDDNARKKKAKKQKKGKENKSPPEVVPKDRRSGKHRRSEEAPSQAPPSRHDKSREDRRKSDKVDRVDKVDKRYTEDYNDTKRHKNDKYNNREIENDGERDERSERRQKTKKRKDKEGDPRSGSERRDTAAYDYEDLDLENSRSRSRSHKHKGQDNGTYYEGDVGRSYDRERQADPVVEDRRDRKKRSDKIDKRDRIDKMDRMDRSDRTEKGDRDREDKLTRADERSERSRQGDRSMERSAEKYNRKAEYREVRETKEVKETREKGRERKREGGERKREKELENDRDSYDNYSSRDRERRRR